MTEVNNKIIDACKNCEHYENSTKTCLLHDRGMHPDGVCPDIKTSK